jgi:nitrite reductase/ring-hydroxylating ferredoxin subunit
MYLAYSVRMKEVKVGSETVLLVKDKGSFSAIANKCSHYGAPLSKGVCISFTVTLILGLL